MREIDLRFAPGLPPEWYCSPMPREESTWPSWRQSLSRKHLASSARKGSGRLAHLGQIPLRPYHVCVKVWGYNPMCKGTTVILHGVASLQ